MPRAVVLLCLILVLACAAAAQEPPRPRLMYHSPQDEMRLLNRLVQARLPMPLERLGVVRRGEVVYGMARFLAPGRDRDDLRRQALRMIRAAFAGMPDLAQLDLAAVDGRETKERKPSVLFSVSARRDRVALLDPARPPGRQLEVFGRSWFSPAVSEAPPPSVGRVLRRSLPPVPAVRRSAPSGRSPVRGHPRQRLENTDRTGLREPRPSEVAFRAWNTGPCPENWE